MHLMFQTNDSMFNMCGNHDCIVVEAVFFTYISAVVSVLPSSRVSTVSLSSGHECRCGRNHGRWKIQANMPSRMWTRCGRCLDPKVPSTSACFEFLARTAVPIHQSVIGTSHGRTTRWPSSRLSQMSCNLLRCVPSSVACGKDACGSSVQDVRQMICLA